MNKNERTMNIANTLKTLGISPGLDGYHYLKCAIKESMEDASLLHRIVYRVYPMIAKKFSALLQKQITPAAVERSIRHAIEQGWSRGSIEEQQNIFGYTVSVDTGRPTNAEFIATVTDYLLMKEEIINGSGQ